MSHYAEMLQTSKCVPPKNPKILRWMQHRVGNNFAKVSSVRNRTEMKEKKEERPFGLYI